MQADPFATTRFTGHWRPYQARVLADLDAHLADRRVHLVAPPGSGKTLLGLDTVRRLGRPALVCAPTRALRQQWLDRFASHFAPADAVRRSDRLRRPADLTATTYQALHAAWAADPAALLAGLRGAGIGTLVVDEAHHLRNAWWAALTAVREALPEVTVVALTATTPVDVPAAEWRRYVALCGPPDVEITVPELVRAGHLAPHADGVWLTRPLPEEQAHLDAAHADAQAFARALATHGPFLDALAAHPWVVEPGAHLDALARGDLGWLVAVLSLLREVGRHDVSGAARVLGLRAVPPLQLSGLDRVLTGALGAQAAALECPDVLRELRVSLRRLGALRGSAVTLQHPRAVREAVRRSTSKLRAAVAVVRHETASRGASLRAVVLADRIHAEALAPGAAEATRRRIGVAPLFDALRRDGAVGDRLGLLTGSLVVLPTDVAAALPGADVEPLAFDTRFAAVTAASGGSSRLVAAVTEALAQGDLRTVVGTVALLGEGWDAPAANVLVVASVAATFVQTGQMRGRVFRLDPGQPDKVASIWHLACTEPGATDGGADLARLCRRFDAFAGPWDTPEGPRLEGGLERLALDGPPFDATALARTNERTLARLLDRERTRTLWRDAVGDDVAARSQRPLLRVPAACEAGGARPRLPAPPSMPDVYAALASGGAVGVGAWAVLPPEVALAVAGLGAGVSAVLGVGLLHAGRRWAQARVRQQIGDAGLRLQRTGQAVLHALRHVGAVGRGTVRVAREPDGALGVRLEGARPADRQVFADALAEVYEPVERPRYLLCVDGRPARAVPAALGARKASAEAFAAAWSRHLEPAEALFTQRGPGRAALVVARARGLVPGPRVERVRRWDERS